MSKNNKRTKFDKDGNAKDKSKITDTVLQERVHRPRIVRPHLAQEYRDRQSIELAEEVTRRLKPNLRGRAMGLTDEHYRYPSFRTTKRRDSIGG